MQRGGELLRILGRLLGRGDLRAGFEGQVGGRQMAEKGVQREPLTLI